MQLLVTILMLVLIGIAVTTFLPEKKKLPVEPVVPCLETEKTMAVDNFRKDSVDLDDLVTVARNGSLSAETLGKLQVFVNTYSLAGFKRYLQNERHAGVADKEAAVLVCLIMDLSYPLLWRDSYMSEREARNYMNAVGA